MGYVYVLDPTSLKRYAMTPYLTFKTLSSVFYSYLYRENVEVVLKVGRQTSTELAPWTFWLVKESNDYSY